MSVTLSKGSEHHSEYTSVDFPTLDSDWTGSVSFYTTYPGTAVFAKAMTRSGNKMLLDLTVGDIIALAVGDYTMISSFSNAVLGVSISSLEYATVVPAIVSGGTMCKVFGTLEKIDGSPAGKETRKIVNTTSGTIVVLGWKGLKVTASLPVADVDSNKVVDVELLTVETNAAGYFEFNALQGLLINVSCPGFGKTVVVNTTGLTSKNISTLF